MANVPESSEKFALKPRQVKALELILSGKSITDTAAACSITPRALHKWLSDSGFRGELTQRSKAMLDQTDARLLSLAEKASKALEDALDSGTTSEKLRAAEVIFTRLAAIRDRGELEEKIAELTETVNEIEKVLGEKGKQ
jgi:hypothetical protein